MFSRFAGAARAVTERAQEEAQALGSPTIEAEHLLLALTTCPDVQVAFAESGIGHDALVEALDLEAAAALQAVGVRADDYGSPPPRRVAAPVAMGTSAKLALQRTLRCAAQRGAKQL
jgi:ATP-dependent Clp protease ATP-binding subunit ClpA